MNTITKTKAVYARSKGWIAAHRLAAGLLAVAISGTGFFIYRRHASASTVAYAYTQVVRGSLSSTVSGSGQVTSLNQIDVVPRVSGDITSIAVTPGQYVHKGDKLFSIDARDALKAVRDAQLAVYSAELDLENAKTDLKQTQDANDLTLGNQLTTLNSTVTAVPDRNNYQTGILSVSGTYNSTEQGRYTLTIYPCIDGTCLDYSGLEADRTQIRPNVPIPLGTRGLYVTFAEQPTAGNTWYIDVPSPLAPSYQSNTKSYTEKAQANSEALVAAQQTVQAKTLALEEKQNALTDAERDLGDYTVRAAFDGTVSSLPVQVGQSVSPSTVLTTLVSNQKLAQISLNEVDAAKVALGQQVVLTFDALPDVKATGTVSELDALGTENQGVVTYNAKVSLNENDPRIKAGMSVSADIVTAEKDNVLTIPNSALKSLRGKSYVEVPSATSSVPVRVPVVVGIANDTRTEIVSGLTEGERIIARTINAASASAASAPSLFGGGATRAGGGNVRVGGGARIGG